MSTIGAALWWDIENTLTLQQLLDIFMHHIFSCACFLALQFTSLDAHVNNSLTVKLREDVLRYLTVKIIRLIEFENIILNVITNWALCIQIISPLFNSTIFIGIINEHRYLLFFINTYYNYLFKIITTKLTGLSFEDISTKSVIQQAWGYPDLWLLGCTLTF